MPGHHVLTEETMRPFFTDEQVGAWIKLGYAKLRRCQFCWAFLEPRYALITACEEAPTEVAELLTTFFPY